MGLYDDDNAAVTGGDLADVIYWQTKFAHLKLEAALKSRQPEKAIASLIPSVVNGANDVLAKYANHAEVKAWKEKAEGIAKKIDPNAPPADFKADFAHWKDYSYEAGWRSYHMARAAKEQKDHATALMHAREVVTQFGRSESRMAAWPADVQTFVREGKAEMEKMAAELKG